MWKRRLLLKFLYRALKRLFFYVKLCFIIFNRQSVVSATFFKHIHEVKVLVAGNVFCSSGDILLVSQHLCTLRYLPWNFNFITTPHGSQQSFFFQSIIATVGFLGFLIELLHLRFTTSAQWVLQWKVCRFSVSGNFNSKQCVGAYKHPNPGCNASSTFGP